MANAQIGFVLAGSTAAYAYGLDVHPKDLDIVVEYQRETWQRILTLAEAEDPQPGGERIITGEPKTLPTQLHFGLGRGIDVLSGFRHATFEEILSRSTPGAVRVELLDELQLPLRVASLEDLIESWRTRGASRDKQLLLAAQQLVGA
jgi:hypothetical protein